jgi:hypothetical protein
MIALSLFVSSVRLGFERGFLGEWRTRELWMLFLLKEVPNMYCVGRWAHCMLVFQQVDLPRT